MASSSPCGTRSRHAGSRVSKRYGCRRSQRCKATVGASRADTWERVNRTVTETRILAPADSRLLYDGVRVLTGLLAAAREHLGADAVVFDDQCRAAKRRALEARTQRGPARRAQTYRKLLRLARRTLGYVDTALPAVTATPAPCAARWIHNANAYSTLLRRVVDQTVQRVLHGEMVPAADKVVSLFEPHADIVRKGGRNTYYGHKVNLATVRSGLELDAVLETANPRGL